jgi:hypothetical protein
MGKRYCFAIDLIDSVQNITEYEMKASPKTVAMIT